MEEREKGKNARTREFWTESFYLIVFEVSRSSIVTGREANRNKRGRVCETSRLRSTGDSQSRISFRGADTGRRPLPENSSPGS